MAAPGGLIFAGSFVVTSGLISCHVAARSRERNNISAPAYTGFGSCGEIRAGATQFKRTIGCPCGRVGAMTLRARVFWSSRAWRPNSCVLYTHRLSVGSTWLYIPSPTPTVNQSANPTLPDQPLLGPFHDS